MAGSFVVSAFNVKILVHGKSLEFIVTLPKDTTLSIYGLKDCLLKEATQLGEGSLFAKPCANIKVIVS